MVPSEHWIPPLQNWYRQNIGSHHYKTGTVRTLDPTITKLVPSEHWIPPLQNWYHQNTGSHHYKTSTVRTLDPTITKLVPSECNDSQNLMDCTKMGVRAQTRTKRQTSLFYSAVSMSQKIPSLSGQLMAWLQTSAHSTIQTLSHHSLRDGGKPPKTSVRITTDSVEIQTGHHPNKNQKPTCD